MGIGLRVNQLNIDPYLIRRLLNAALKNVRYAKLLRDLGEVGRLALIPLRGSTRDHFQIRDLSQPRQDFLLYAIREIGIGFVFTKVFKRQHRDAFLADSGHRRSRSFRSSRNFAPRMPQPIASNRQRADDQTHSSEQPDPVLIRGSKITTGLGRLLNHTSLDLKGPSEHERHGKTKRNPRNKYRQNPLRCVVGRHDCRADLDDEPGNYCIAHRDAIDLPLFQLTEEGVHIRLRRLRSVGYLRATSSLQWVYAKAGVPASVSVGRQSA